MMATAVSGFIAGAAYNVPAGKTLLFLQVSTYDYNNISGASFSITATGKSYTVNADASGRATQLVDSGYTYNVALSHTGTYLNDGDQSVVANNGDIAWVFFDLSEPAVQTYSNVSVSGWAADNTYQDFPYKAAITLAGVTANDLPQVVYDVPEALSGDYAPVANSYNGGVYVYSKKTDTITIPSIIIMRQA